MCGILCRVADSPAKLPSPIVVESTGMFNTWETDDASVINQFVGQDISQYQLSQSDQNKLDNLDLLRQLNQELNRVNNNIKSKDITKIEQIQEKIDQIINQEITIENKTITFDNLIYSITARGPDYINLTQFVHQKYQISMFSSVLSLRQPFTSQPIHNNDFILQFNGELYNQQTLLTNDTNYICDLLQQNLNLSNCSRSQAIFNTLYSLSGEFAFVIYDLQSNLIYFGRDSIGKRSLLYSYQNNQLLISSVPSIGSIECKNEILTFNIDTHELIKYPYATSYHPLPFNNLCINQANHLLSLLKKSVKIRQDSIYPLHPHKASLSVLFSGGLDCTVIASLICENLKQNSSLFNIDLLTVGFDNPRTNQSANCSPDRKLAKRSWFELAKKYNSSFLNLRLVEVDVDYKSWLLHQKRVKDLMYPVNTEMDLSIAIAFYFASSNSLAEVSTSMIELTNECPSFEAFLQNESDFSKIEPNYNSDASVLFSGLGADELFAGYSRHEAIFQKLTPNSSTDEISDCYDKLSTELIHDINVIHTRNLGRDDRAISCWGKELRYPYLDVELINYVINHIEPNLKFDYKFEKKLTKKQGEIMVMVPTRKFILREVASLLGLDFVKDEVKRAIQFGAKSAKLEIGQSKTKGTDRL